MIVNRRLGRYSYKVIAPECYTTHATSRFGLKPDDPFFVIRSGIPEWLNNLRPVSFELMGRKISRPAVHWTYHSGRIPPGKPLLPPAIYFARKSDVILFKLTWGGK